MPLIGITADFMRNGKRPVLTGLSCIAVPFSADAVRKRIEKPIQSKVENRCLGPEVQIL